MSRDTFFYGVTIVIFIVGLIKAIISYKNKANDIKDGYDMMGPWYFKILYVILILMVVGIFLFVYLNKN